jgi:alkanesulfonate monooxygenase SsuD/methylene tetrahydromethanopterin reductase-like flavin-dependent oxidoreductase (luciferase family)
MSPLHLGCSPWLLPSDCSAALLTRQAQFAERIGFGSFWLPETHFGHNAIPEPLMLLAAVAAATQHIRLATSSYLLPLRHPLQAAEQVAVLDQLSCGRVILGVGRGYAPELFEAFRIERSAKRELFAECLAAMRAAWSGCVVGGGEARIGPRPVQQPHPPVWVAAFGPKALAQAGALGLPYLASPMESLATLEDNHAQHRAACRSAGHAVPEATPVMRTVFVSEDRRRVAEVRSMLENRMTQMRARGAPLVRSDPGRVEDWALIGSPQQVRQQIARYRERLGMSHLIATQLHLAGFDEKSCEGSLTALAELVREDS